VTFALPIVSLPALVRTEEAEPAPTKSAVDVNLKMMILTGNGCAGFNDAQIRQRMHRPSAGGGRRHGAVPVDISGSVQ
jgi:hypothetical protein